MRRTFSSSFRDMTYNYHLKQQLLMCEVGLNQILAGNLRLIYRLKRLSSNSYTRKSTILEKKLSVREIEKFCHKKNNKTNFFEDYVNVVHSTKKRNKLLKVNIILFFVIISLFSFFVLFIYIKE